MFGSAVGAIYCFDSGFGSGQRAAGSRNEVCVGFALTWIDFAVIAAYFLLNIGIGLAYRSRASKSIDDYFVSGRSVPWWLAGTSMVATTFAADTPLAVTGMVARNGIAGNWLWWNFVFSGMMTVFLFARLWRRSGVLTDVEFAEIRYSGKPAAILRGFRAIYLGVPINCMVLGWVNLAMVKILVLLFGIGKEEAILVIFGIIGVTAFISTLSGLWGVLVTDLVQFVIKMGMTIVLAVYAVNAVGGISPLKEKLLAVDAARGILAGSTDSVLSFIPDLHSTWMPFIAFFAYLAVNWWASWYPGAEPGGGGYIAQRMLSAKDEKHSLLATLWFNIAHYAIRPWPWILIGLTTLILYPGLEDPETGYVKVMIEHLPPYLRGLMIASFLAAYMSTVSTQLNWGASYIVNDFYRRFLRQRERQATCSSPARHGAAHDRRGGDLRVDSFRCIPTADGDRSGYGRRAAAALVLVAHQRVERDLRDGGVLARFGFPATLSGLELPDPGRLRIRTVLDGRNHNRGVGEHNISHQPGTRFHSR